MMTPDQVIAALLLGAGLLWALPAVLALVGQERESEGRITERTRRRLL
jgi:hypothetical protein